MRAIAARIVWFITLPLFIAMTLLFVIGVVLERTGDALQEGSNDMRTELIRWARVLFCVTGRR